jgi:hypothetical protein
MYVCQTCTPKLRQSLALAVRSDHMWLVNDLFAHYLYLDSPHVLRHELSMRKEILEERQVITRILCA